MMEMVLLALVVDLPGSPRAEGNAMTRRDELEKIIADLERDLEIARRAVPDLEAAHKVARDLAVIRDLEFKLALAQAEWKHDYEGGRCLGAFVFG